jgi:hypothetical protein
MKGNDRAELTKVIKEAQPTLKKNQTHACTRFGRPPNLGGSVPSRYLRRPIYGPAQHVYIRHIYCVPPHPTHNFLNNVKI